MVNPLGSFVMHFQISYFQREVNVIVITSSPFNNRKDCLCDHEWLTKKKVLFLLFLAGRLFASG